MDPLFSLWWKNHDRIWDTKLKNFPLFYLKCKHESLINIKHMNMLIIQELVLYKKFSFH